ncbi:MAG: Smr/MutS family protein [Tannerellaceae bacterium]|jgi:DNA mismatch repair protein MutS2|nr:Smr/MutS family protein [Tannerellaceae bacterium]
MIYPTNFEQKTGFDKIRALLSERCLSPLGQERVSMMSFTADFGLVSRMLDEAGEFIEILQNEREFPSSWFFDLRLSLKRIRPEGSFLDAQELFDLRRSLSSIRDITQYLKPPEGEQPAWPALSGLAAGVQTFPQIIAAADRILDKAGHIKNDASPALARIRREIVDTSASISKSLQSILRSAQNDGVVDKDAAPTVRDGRLMIPVAPALKRKIRGIVHDESASGKTVFIEPEAVVEANNRIRELEGEERREIIRILIEVTNAVRLIAPDMLLSYEFLADIDFIRAKALFAVQINAIRPQLDNCRRLDFIRAVHPLLYLSHLPRNTEVVPLDIELTAEQRILLISGPNAGGKSVCLKTVGLLQYMLQCGMPIPVDERSRAGIFADIFIDIGDEQSIENDLSTYSSHLLNMKFFDKHAGSDSLILIDEFGSGTEPRIGGAIAEALLQRFNSKESFGVITTHYQNLKQMAADTPGIINGAMLYDRQLMRPLFKLAAGHPGSSFAIEIARKTGLPEEVIAEASRQVGSDYVNMDKYLLDIVRDKRYWETKRENIRREEKKLNELIAANERDHEEITRRRNDIIAAAKNEASAILDQANARIEQVIRQIKEAQAGKEETKEARQSLGELKSSLSAKVNPAPQRAQPKSKEPINVGDQVRMRGQQTSGVVLSIRNKEATVAFGMIKSVLKLGKLEKAPAPKPADNRSATFLSSRTSDDIHQRKLRFKPELDIRGLRAVEALQAVAYFIDDAILASISPVRILHGTGAGALRSAVRDYLHSANGVGGFRDEHVQLGGAGVTVVELL